AIPHDSDIGILRRRHHGVGPGRGKPFPGKAVITWLVPDLVMSVPCTKLWHCLARKSVPELASFPGYVSGVPRPTGARRQAAPPSRGLRPHDTPALTRDSSKNKFEVRKAAPGARHGVGTAPGRVPAPLWRSGYTSSAERREGCPAIRPGYNAGA